MKYVWLLWTVGCGLALASAHTGFVLACWSLPRLWMYARYKWHTQAHRGKRLWLVLNAWKVSQNKGEIPSSAVFLCVLIWNKFVLISAYGCLELIIFEQSHSNHEQIYSYMKSSVPYWLQLFWKCLNQNCHDLICTDYVLSDSIMK